MKVRNGFVSNSSSTSFALYGAYVSDDQVMAAGLHKGLFTEEKQDDYEAYDVIDTLLEEVDLTYSTPNGEYLVGQDYDDMGEDETKKQFQERIKNTLQEIFGGDIICSYESGEYYS